MTTALLHFIFTVLSVNLSSVLQVSMTMTTSTQRSLIVIPAQGLIEIRDTLTDLLKEFGTDNKGELL